MKKKFALLIALSGLLLFFDLLFGSAYLPFRTVWDTLTGNNADAVYHEIIFNHRLPKAFTAILTGAALSVAGVLMQTLFRNPLAGPDVLGVTSGASLGVALLTFCASSFPWLITTGWGQILAAVIGSLIVLSLIILASIQIPQTISLLIVGMMFGNFAGAIVSILQNSSNPDTLKLFVTWTFGSLSRASWREIGAIAVLSAPFGLAALVPVSVGVMINYIFMWSFSIPFDIVTVGFSSVAIGCGVDDALHFIIRYRLRRKENPQLSTIETVKANIIETGRPIILTTVSVDAGISASGGTNFGSLVSKCKKSIF